VTEPPPQLAAFSHAYAAALQHYVREPSEDSLTAAYELGRTALTRQLSVLDVAVAHHDALAQLLAPPRGADQVPEAADSGPAAEVARGR
jgi:hypothetical protein